MASTYQMPVDVVCEDGFVPEYKHEGDAGADLRAHIDGPLTIQQGESAWVPTGVRLAIPEGHVGLQFPRSGLGCNHGICLANGTGVIDSGYRGEVMAKLLNLGSDPFTVNPGDRICQLVILPYTKAKFWTVDELSESDREADGYGSTGLS